MKNSKRRRILNSMLYSSYIVSKIFSIFLMPPISISMCPPYHSCST